MASFHPQLARSGTRLTVIASYLRSNAVYSAVMAGLKGVSWEELLSGIREAFSSNSVDVDAVIGLLSSYRSRREDWLPFAKFDTHRLALAVGTVQTVLFQLRRGMYFRSGTRGTW